MLARFDETDLLIPLHNGLYEEPRWHTFLYRLRRRTMADYAALIFRQGESPMHEATELFSGRDVRAAAKNVTPGDLYRLDPIPYNELKIGRVYSVDELIDVDNPQHDHFRRNYLEKVGLKHGRVVRVAEMNGASAWLIINREETDFSASDGSLLSGLAPHVAVALRTFSELERERHRAAIGASALSRTGLGWIALDREARLVDLDQTAMQMLAQATGMTQRIGMPLFLSSANASRELAQTSAVFEKNTVASSQLIRISDDPVLDLFVTPASHRPLVALSLATVIGFLRKEQGVSEKRRTMLSQAYGLSSGEANLALALCNGQSIREAAVELGLTLETARNYSKKIYAKTHTRGQVDLVRKLLTSIFALVQ